MAYERIMALEKLLGASLFEFNHQNNQARVLQNENELLSETVEQQAKKIESLSALLESYKADLLEDPSERAKALESEIEYLKEIVKKQLEKETHPEVLRL